jgi:hypothetical protein
LAGIPLFKSERAAQFLDPVSVKAVSDAVASLAIQHGAPSLIIIDTLARNFGAGDENNTKDMSEFVVAVDDLKARFPSAAVLIIHHSGHAEKQRARGAMALKGALDTEYRVEKDGPAVRLINTKMKDAEPPEGKLRAILLGIAIGDALGNTSESYRPRDRMRAFGEITNYLPNRHAQNRSVGLPSDDTQMSFWLLEHLLEEGLLEPELLADIFATRSIFGMGQSVRGFRANRARGLSWQAAGVASAGNGAIMRIAPMLFTARTLNGVGFARSVARCAAITHNEEGAIASAVAWVYLLAELSSLQSLPSSLKASITNGRRTTWRLGSGVLLATQRVPRRLTRLRIFAVKPMT